MSTPLYKVGLSKEETNKDALIKSGFQWEKVNPREKIVSLVETFIDVPYKFGASVLLDSPLAFDCSSLTAYLYVQAGIAIPRVCNDQYNFGVDISESDAKPGDLVFFKGNPRADLKEDAIGHVGIYMGRGEMIHAGGISMGYGKVLREKIFETKYFPTGFKGYRRLVQDEAERFVVEIPEDRPGLRSKEALLKELP